MSNVDDVIRERLRKLKCEENTAGPSSNQITRIPTQPKKTNAEQLEDLLQELSDEINLDDTYGKDKAEIDAQIRRRLDRLKVWDLGPPRATFKEIGRLRSVADVVSEVLSRPDFQPVEKGAAIYDDKDSGKNSADEDISSDDSDSPPDYCVFCKSSEPAIVCIDCYKDSYCTKCFNEFHEPEDEHKTFKYVQKKKKRC